MNKISRMRLFIDRFLVARKYGINFPGTSHFSLPSVVRIGGSTRELSFPDDPALALDVMGLWLDDDYGLARLKNPVRTVIDIGANVGLFSLLVNHHFPKAIIHAYEPNPCLIPHLQANLSGLDEVTVWEEGVSDRKGLATMNLKATQSSRLGQTIASEHGSIKLVGIKDAVSRMNGRIDLLKLDCEGAEWQIFRDPAAFSGVSQIRMEYHLVDGHRVEDLFAVAAKLSYQITYIAENDGYGIAYWER